MSQRLPVISLHNGAARAEIIPALGARISSCVLPRAGGAPAPVLHPFPTDETQVEQWAKGGIYPLVPYWGRIANSLLHFGGHQHALTAYPDAAPHTLHGIAQRRPWDVTQQTEQAITLAYVHQHDAHWPWPFEATLQVQLHPDALEVRIAVKNTADEMVPAGIGLHPYLPASAQSKLHFQAPCLWEASPDYLALRPAKVPPQADFSTARELGEVTFTGLYQNWRSPIALTSLAGERLLLSASETLDHLVIHQPGATPYVCIEPVSHTADAFNLHERHMPGTGTRLLAPGEELSGRMTLAWD